MGSRVGKQKENRPVSGFTVSELNDLVERGGKDKAKALNELAKRGHTS